MVARGEDRFTSFFDDLLADLVSLRCDLSHFLLQYENLRDHAFKENLIRRVSHFSFRPSDRLLTVYSLTQLGQGS